MARKHKSDIPEVVLDYCIDEKLTVAEGIVAFLEDKFATVDSTLRELKREVTGAIYTAQAGPDIEKIDKQDMDDIDSFLKFLDQQMPEDPTDK
tara:strand:- start:77 stop:355 length:279 start_codon:yes stop_codon:yes gene_type:complete